MRLRARANRVANKLMSATPIGTGNRTMNRRFVALLALTVTLVPVLALAQTQWAEGRNYFTITPALRTSVPPGKVEVTEVFSYGCPHCSEFQPVAAHLKTALPPNVVFNLVPASFSAAEDWPMFQRAYVTAELLGIAERTHQAIFDAIWKTCPASWRTLDSSPRGTFTTKALY